MRSAESLLYFATALLEKAGLSGVALHETILPKLAPWAERFGVALPAHI